MSEYPVFTERSYRAARELTADKLRLGRHVIVTGWGGSEGYVVGVRKRHDGPFSSDYPVFYVRSKWTGQTIGGNSVANLAPGSEVLDLGDELQCHVCLTYGVLELFGVPRRCPNCQSESVHLTDSPMAGAIDWSVTS